MAAPSGVIVDDISLLPSIKDRFDGPIPFGLINAVELDWISNPRAKLGSGTYGEVYKYDDSPFGKVAVKFLKHNGNLRADIVLEIALLRAINDPNVISIKEIFITPESIGIVLPLATTTLDSVIEKKKIPAVPPNRPSFALDNEELIDSILYQILRGIVATQDNNIFNGDYKPANILIFNEENSGCVTAQIADFGLAQPDLCYGPLIQDFAFTRYYRPPEILLKEIVLYGIVPDVQKQLTNNESSYDAEILKSFISTYKNLRDISFGYTRESDAWAYGCIMAELILGFPPFRADSDPLTLKKEIELTGNSKPLGQVPDSFLPLVTEMKKWYSLYLTYTGEIAQNRNKKEDFPLYGLIKTIKYKKYIPIIMKLLSFYPSDRPDLRSLLRDPIFNNVKSKLKYCLNEQDEKLQRSRDLNIYCIRYLMQTQFPILLAVPVVILKVRIHLLYYLEGVVQFFRLKDRTKARTIEYVFTFGARDLKESQDDRDWIITRYEGFCLSAVLLASRFETSKIDINKLANYSKGKFNSKFIFTGALKIFAACNFELLRSTSYDILSSLQFVNNDRLSNIADILLDLSYFTSISSNYKPSIIAEAMRSMAAILGNIKIEFVEPINTVEDCIKTFLGQLDLCIEIGGLLSTPLSNFDRGDTADGSSVITTEVIDSLSTIKEFLGIKVVKTERRKKTGTRKE